VWWHSCSTFEHSGFLLRSHRALLLEKKKRFETLVSISFSAAKETLRTKYLTLKLFTIGGDKATPQMLQESDSTIVSTTTRYNNYVMIQPYNSAMVQGII